MPRKKLQRNDSILSSCFEWLREPIEEDSSYGRPDNLVRNQQGRYSLHRPNRPSFAQPGDFTRDSKFRYSLRSPRNSKDSGVNDLSHPSPIHTPSPSLSHRTINTDVGSFTSRTSDLGSLNTSSSSLLSSSQASSISYHRLSSCSEDELAFNLHIFFYCMAINFKLGCDESIDHYREVLSANNFISSREDFQEIMELLQNNIEPIIEQPSYQSIKAKVYLDTAANKLKEKIENLEQHASPMTFKRVSPVKNVPAATVATLGGYIFYVCWRACSEFSKQRVARELLSYSEEINNGQLIELIATLSALYIINNYDKEIRRKYNKKSELNLRDSLKLFNSSWGKGDSYALPLDGEIKFIEKRAKKHAQKIHACLVEYVKKRRYRDYETKLYKLIPNFSHCSQDQRVMEKRNSLYALLGAFDLSLEDVRGKDALYAQLSDILNATNSFVEVIDKINRPVPEDPNITKVSSLDSGISSTSEATLSRQQSLQSEVSSSSFMRGSPAFFSRKYSLEKKVLSQTLSQPPICYPDQEVEAEIGTDIETAKFAN